MENKIYRFIIIGLYLFSCNISESQNLTPLNSNEIDSKIFIKKDNSESELNKDSDNNSNLSVVTVLAHDGIHSRHSAPQSLFRYARCYFLITGQEMNLSGYPSGVKITSLGYNYKYGTELSTKGFLKVYFENTNDVTNNKSLNWNQTVSTMTQVHADTIAIPLSAGIFDIPLNNYSAFTYTGGGIYVAFEYSNPSGPLAVYSNVAWCNKVLPNPILKSSQSDDSLRVIATGTSNLRPETRFGTELRDIVTVGPVYSKGMMNISPCIDSNQIRFLINHRRNLTDTIYVISKIKNISTGEVNHIFYDTVISNFETSIELSHKYLITSETGTDSVLISASTFNEDITGNNKAFYILKRTVNSSSPYIPGIAPSGGAGFSVGTGDYVAKFHTECELPVCAVDASFYVETGFGSVQYKIVFFAADGPGGLPGTLLHSSPLRVSPSSQTGVIKRQTYYLSSPLKINPGYYYAGYKQAEAKNLRVSYQIETPIRTGEFYYTSPAGAGNWTEFAGISPYKFDIVPRTYLTLKLRAYLQGFVSGGKLTPDTLKIFLRRQFPPYVRVDSAKAVIDSAGYGIFNFVNADSDSCYYFEVTHRNHLRTFSNNFCHKLNSAPANYDFTNSSSQALGNNMVYVPEINGLGAFAFYGGDVNQDEIIDASDISNVENDAANFVTGYVSTDITGDYTVDASDISLVENNAVNLIGAVTP